MVTRTYDRKMELRTTELYNHIYENRINNRNFVPRKGTSYGIVNVSDHRIKANSISDPLNARYVVTVPLTFDMKDTFDELHVTWLDADADGNYAHRIETRYDTALVQLFEEGDGLDGERDLVMVHVVDGPLLSLLYATYDKYGTL